MKEYKLVGAHAEDLDDGRVVNPGEIFEMRVNEDDPHNKRLVDEGLVLEVTAEDKKKAEAAAKAAAKAQVKADRDNTEEDDA